MPRTPTHPADRILAGRRWHNTRAAIRKRDGNRCQGCGTDHNLTVHHIIPRRARPDLAFEPSNLVTLCAACHHAIEKGGRGNGKRARKHANAREAALRGRFFESASAYPADRGFSLPAPENRRTSRIW